MRFTPTLLALAVLASGCLPYAVGSTARTQEPNERPVATTTLQFVPIGGEFDDSGGDGDGSLSTSYPQIDTEVRFGLNERSDVGARFVGGSGFVVNYKRRIAGSDPLGPGVAFLGGGGVLNVGNHAHLEASLIASGSEYGPATPYGGLRAMQVIPLNSDAVSDSPTLGAFVGLRLGNEDFSILPEVGVFYDRSALDIRESDWVVIPSLSVRGFNLFRRFF